MVITEDDKVRGQEEILADLLAIKEDGDKRGMNAGEVELILSESVEISK